MVMEELLTSAGTLVALLICVLPLVAYLRRHDNDDADIPLTFEDPNSLKQVPCPHIRDPAENYKSLIIPAYNEEHRLPSALQETMNYLQERERNDPSFTFEVIIIDDGSADDTKRVAFDFVRNYSINNVRVLLLKRNQGKVEATRQGMLHARGELLLMLDADGATQVEDLEKVENHILSVSKNQSRKVSDVSLAVFGSRAHLEEKALATRKWYRNFLMKAFHIVVLVAVGRGIRDTQCGFKMFTRSAARKLFTNLRLKRWCFDVELVFLCKWFKIPMVEVPVNWTEIPGSKVNMLSTLSMLWEICLMCIGYRTRMWSLST